MRFQNFSVLTTNDSTEYGRASGGVINATNQVWHEPVPRERLRVSSAQQLAGRAKFLRPGRTEAAFRRNQFGASAGGPIIKNKTFVFGDYGRFAPVQRSIVRQSHSCDGHGCGPQRGSVSECFFPHQRQPQWQERFASSHQRQTRTRIFVHWSEIKSARKIIISSAPITVSQTRIVSAGTFYRDKIRYRHAR